MLMLCTVAAQEPQTTSLCFFGHILNTKCNCEPMLQVNKKESNESVM